MSKLPAKKQEHKASNPPDSEGDITLEEKIDRQIGDLAPRKTRDQIVARVSTLVMSEHFSGPIAHPRHLREYENICPGAADRIITMAEERHHHIIDMESRIQSDEARDQRRGMRYGAVLFGILIASALFSAYMEFGSLIVGLFLSTAAIGAIGAFIKGRNGG